MLTLAQVQNGEEIILKLLTFDQQVQPITLLDSRKPAYISAEDFGVTNYVIEKMKAESVNDLRTMLVIRNEDINEL